MCTGVVGPPSIFWYGWQLLRRIAHAAKMPAFFMVLLQLLPTIYTTKSGVTFCLNVGSLRVLIVNS